MQTILGAGGAIGTELLNELVGKQQPLRLVARNPKEIQGVTETVAADISDLAQTISAVAGSTVVYLLVGLKYDVGVWRELWPRIMPVPESRPKASITRSISKVSLAGVAIDLTAKDGAAASIARRYKS